MLDSFKVDVTNVLSSRPWQLSDSTGVPITKFDTAELELIGAFLWCTRLGKGISPHRDAAFTLMSKIEEEMGANFLSDAAADVDLHVTVNNNLGQQIGRYHQSDVEFEV